MNEPSTPPAASRTDVAAPTLGLTVASLPKVPLDHVASLAARVHHWSISSVWVAETVGTEAFAHLGSLGASSSVDLGTGVLAAPLRTPQLAAMGAATLQALYPDRSILLGVGVSSPTVVERWHGRPYPDRPLAFMRDHLSVIRACWTGETVDHRSDFSSASRFRLGVRPLRSPRLVLGALNQRMLELAGELADGVLLNYLPSTAVPWCRDQIRRGEQRAGRPEGSCRIHAYVHVGVSDPERYRDLARRDLFSYAVVDAYANAFARAGFADDVEAIRRHHAARERDLAVAAVSDDMCDAIDTVGDAATITTAVRGYFDAGVDDVVIMPLPWGDNPMDVVEATLDASSAALPTAK